MYQEHFGLNRPPFKITPDTSLFFEGSKRGAALGALVYAITSGEGIIKVVGEVGSGKTMLCRMLELRLAELVDVVYIANPSLSPDNILHVIAHELNLDITNQSNKLDVMQKLQAYLLQKHAGNRQVVVFVEEAQSMPVETLEEIRLLSNLETDQNKLLQMVLFGQPELDEKLAQPHIRQLKERITHSFYLDPFPPKDTLDYLNFRMRAVGYRGPDIFNQKTAKEVIKYSGGLTRRINILADKALLASYSEGKHEVTTRHVQTAATDSEFRNAAKRLPWLMLAGFILALALAVWAGMQIPAWLDKPADKQGRDTSQGLDSEAALESNATHNSGQAPSADLPIADLSKTAGAQIASNDESVLVHANVSAGANTPDSNEAEADLSAARPLSELLQQRMSATQSWLKTAVNQHRSIQLFMLDSSEIPALNDFLSAVPEMLDIQQIYIYETIINGRRMYSVLHGEYSSRQTARTVLQMLPVEMQVSKPFLRRISAIRNDLVPNG